MGYDEIDDLRVDAVIDPVGGDVFTRSLALLKPLGADRRDRLHRRALGGSERPWLVGRNVGVVRASISARLIEAAPELVRERVAEELLELWRGRRDRAARGLDVPARDSRGRRTR